MPGTRVLPLLAGPPKDPVVPPHRSSGSCPTCWCNWRRDGNRSAPMTGTRQDPGERILHLLESSHTVPSFQCCCSYGEALPRDASGRHFADWVSGSPHSRPTEGDQTLFNAIFWSILAILTLMVMFTKTPLPPRLGSPRYMLFTLASMNSSE